MEQITRNRLVGGGVLLFAGLLLAPVLLTPENDQLSNPELAINFDSDDKVTNETIVADTKIDQAVVLPSVPQLELESVDNDLVSNVAVAFNQPNNGAETKKADSKESTSVNSVALPQKGTWLRVASFSDLKNADKLASDLKRRNFPVKTIVVEVAGKNYKRVLVGPYSSDEKMQLAIKRITADGYSPTVQNK